jgi:hypothetical protein
MTPASSKVSLVQWKSSIFSPPNTLHPVPHLSDASKDAPKVGKTSEPPVMATHVTALGKSIQMNSIVTMPSSTTGNKVPMPMTIKLARTVKGSIGPPPVQPRTLLSTMTLLTGISHVHVLSASSMLGQPGAKLPLATTMAGSRWPTLMSGTELLHQVKLTATVMKASTLLDIDSLTSKQGSLDFGSDKKENTMQPFLPCCLASFSDLAPVVFAFWHTLSSHLCEVRLLFTLHGLIIN